MDQTIESQRREIRELVAQYQLAVKAGTIRHNQQLDAEIRRQYERSRSQEREGIER
jgi:hypothetical protein